MSKDAVEDLFGRALTNRAFRDALLAGEPDAIASYDLTDDERTHVFSWTAATFDSVIGKIEADLDGAAFDGIGFQPEISPGEAAAPPAIPPAALRRFVA